MGRKKTFEKEPVTIRFKELTSGNKSIYLDIYQDGVRHYEFLKLYLVPEVGRSKSEARRKNAETMAAANVIKAQRVLDIKNGMAGIEITKGKMLLVDWIAIYAKSRERTTKSLNDITGRIRNTKRQLLLYKGDKVRMKDIDKKYCLGFLEHLRNARKTNGEPLSMNTKASYYGCLCAMLYKAVQDGIIQKNPFTEIDTTEKFHIEDSNRVYLTIDELRKMASTECRFTLCKQAFMFSCFCGLRISDIRKLKWSDIQEVTAKDGTRQYRLGIRMEKTKKTITYQLSNEALKWLPERGESELVFDGLVGRSRIGLNLRIWAKDAGITKYITFHTARHTFATMMLTLGADIYTTSKLLGHSRIDTTEIYAKIIDKKKDEAMSLIDKFFDK